MWEEAKALGNWLHTKEWAAAFRSFMDAVALFDDSRLSLVTVVTMIQQYAVLLQKFQDSVDDDCLLQMFLEGIRFFVPSVAEEETPAECHVPTSNREAVCLQVLVQSCIAHTSRTF
jgi:hypothetical protein